MKCKAGQMAKIVKRLDECTSNLLGETVMCIRVVAHYDDGDASWAIECGKSLHCDCGANRVIAYPDSCMQPIEPPADDAVDEMVKRVGPAKKIEVPEPAPVARPDWMPSVKPVTAAARS